MTGESPAPGQGSEAPSSGKLTPCRLVGRFAPIVGVFAAQRKDVTFESSPHLPRQLPVSLTIPTRAIRGCTTEGCVLSMAVQGMAGRGLTFEYESPVDCSDAASAVATAGLMSDDDLDDEREDPSSWDGSFSAVMDEVVLRYRFRFVLDDNSTVLAWERVKRYDLEKDDSKPDSGIMYVCEGAIIFLPDRQSRSGSEASLRASATILMAKDLRNVKEVFGGVVMEGVCSGAGNTVKARFELGLAQDWEALAQTVHALISDDRPAVANLINLEEENEPVDTREQEWRGLYGSKSGSELRGDGAIKSAVWGSMDSFIPSQQRGLPRGCREMMWLKLSGAEELKAKHPSGYAKTLLHPPSSGQPSDARIVKAESEIDKDLKRTFGEEELQNALAAMGRKNKGNIDWFTSKLKRVLLAYAKHNKRIGYCQSFNFIGGVCVIVIDKEEDCFWLLVAMLDNLLPKTYYGDLSGVMLDVQALDALLNRHLKPVKDKLELTHLPLTSFAAQWFMCAFVNVLSIPSVVRVWDCLFVDGHVVLFRVAMAMLKAIEGELGLATEMEDAMMALQRARTLEIETVLQIANGCFGDEVVNFPQLMQLRNQAIRSTNR